MLSVGRHTSDVSMVSPARPDRTLSQRLWSLRELRRLSSTAMHDEPGATSSSVICLGVLP